MSLSKAHSVKVLLNSYYDSGGDHINRPFSPVSDSIILEFQFGEPPNNTTLYVPARIVTGGTAYVIDPGPRTVGNGITFQATSPAGTSTSPGVPLAQKSLVTTSPSEVAYGQAVVYNDLLLMHQLCSINDTRELQCHGGISYSTETIADTLGHTVGRRVVNIGHGGVLYKLPADTLKSGPPQGVRGLRIITEGSSNPYRNRVHHAKDNSGYGTMYLLSYYGNTATIEWQVNNSSSYTMGSLWSTLNTGGGASSGNVPSGYGSSSSTWSTSVAPNVSCTLYFINGVDSVQWHHFIRAKATTPEGAVTYSNTCAVTGNDQDGSWSVTWYGLPEYHGPSESTSYYYESWLPGAATLYH
jgi:hypothetical protein